MVLHDELGIFIFKRATGTFLDRRLLEGNTLMDCIAVRSASAWGFLVRKF